MKSTGVLSVSTNFKLKDRIAIHPNDAFDIGLFTNSYNKMIKLMYNDGTPAPDSFQCEIYLVNECKNGMVEIGNNFWQRLGKPDRIKLSVENDIFYLVIC